MTFFKKKAISKCSECHLFRLKKYGCVIIVSGGAVVVLVVGGIVLFDKKQLRIAVDHALLLLSRDSGSGRACAQQIRLAFD
jgi:hypothetical protein